MGRSVQQQDNHPTNPDGDPVRIRDIPAELAWKLAGAFAVALIAGLLFLDLIHLLVRPIGILIASIVLAMALAPLVSILERRMRRGIAIVVVYLALAIILFGFGFVLIQPLVQQISSLIAEREAHAEQLREWVDRFDGQAVDAFAGRVGDALEPIADVLLALPAVIVAAGLEILIIAFVSLYWLLMMPRLKAFTVSLFPPDRQDEASKVLSRIGERMGGYIRGIVITGSVVGTAVFIAMTILGIQYALLLGLLSFLGEFFPNVGPILAAIPAVIIALFDSMQLAVIVIIFYIIVQQVESLILLPFVMRGLAEIPPLVATMAVFTGFLAGGVLWALLAIPISGALLTLATDVAAPAIRRRTGSSPPDDEDDEDDDA